MAESEVCVKEGTGGSRTVQMNRVSLQFEDAEIEYEYYLAHAERQKSLWLRALLVSAIFQVVFYMGDVVDSTDPPPHTHVIPQMTAPIRFFIASVQMSLFALLWLNLIPPRETLMLSSSLVYAIPTLAIHALQRDRLHQWDSLYLVYGMCYFIVPKLSPMRFFAASVGSAVVTVTYFWIAVFIRPSPLLHTVMAAVYVTPLVCLCSYVSYSMEKSSRERFVLRHVLKREHKQRISFTMTKNTDKTCNEQERLRMLLGMLPWVFVCVCVYVHGYIPPVIAEQLLRDLDASKNGIAHVLGFAFFILAVTRKARYMVLTAVVGTLLVWLGTRAFPPEEVYVTSQSVGYAMLGLSLVCALGVFGRFVYVWGQVLIFLRHMLVLVPPSHTSHMQHRFPVIRSILSSLPLPPPMVLGNTAAHTHVLAQLEANELRPAPASVSAKHGGSSLATKGRGNTETHTHTHTHTRIHTHSPIPTPSNTPTPTPTEERKATKQKAKKTSDTMEAPLILVSPAQVSTSNSRQIHQLPSDRHESMGPTSEPNPNPNPSLNPNPNPNSNVTHVCTRWPRKCFFCLQGDTQYYVPVCGCWGVWAAWHTHMLTAIDAGETSFADALKESPMQPCTTFTDIVTRERSLRSVCGSLEEKVSHLEAQVKHWRQEAKVFQTRYEKLIKP